MNRSVLVISPKNTGVKKYLTSNNFMKNYQKLVKARKDQAKVELKTTHKNQTGGSWYDNVSPDD